jgi:hypothetical protein
MNNIILENIRANRLIEIRQLIDESIMDWCPAIDVAAELFKAREIIRSLSRKLVTK